jgi:N-acetyl sugar amidotransferase
MKYCNNCFLPSTKPQLTFDEKGICSACLNYWNRPNIDWKKRKDTFLNIIHEIKKKNHSNNWDCVVPVSGGKDSTYQALKLRELGLNPLCVTATTCDLSELGRKNIENLKHLGFDYIEFSTNPLVRKKLNRIGLEMIGDISWPEHISINTIPITIAIKYDINLIIWGENSQNEYGGLDNAAKARELTWEWLMQFAGFVGLRISDIEGMYGLEKKDLIPFYYPSMEEIKKAKIQSLFLGYFFPWSGYENYEYAIKHGFTTYDKWVEGSYGNYENLDNFQTSIHDYFKFLKFGWSRATDILSMAIRRKQISRAQAFEIIKERDGKYPSSYLGKSLKQILSHIDMNIEEFDSICDKFTNKDIFLCNNKGELIKDENKSLIKKKYDN